ncbi:hypothetical protein TMEC54S_00878 [Thauera mechernichensis]
MLPSAFAAASAPTQVSSLPNLAASASLTLAMALLAVIDNAIVVMTGTQMRVLIIYVSFLVGVLSVPIDPADRMQAGRFSQSAAFASGAIVFPPGHSSHRPMGLNQVQKWK